MGMGMKFLKWEGTSTKNLFPHTSTSYVMLMHSTFSVLRTVKMLSSPIQLH